MESKKYIYGSEEPRGKTGIKSQMQRMDLRTWGGGRVSWDEVREWMDIYTLPNVKQIASGKKPHSTGRSARCFVTTKGVGEGGRGYGDICIRIADSLCYTEETNTPL